MIELKCEYPATLRLYKDNDSGEYILKTNQEDYNISGDALADLVGSMLGLPLAPLLELRVFSKEELLNNEVSWEDPATWEKLQDLLNCNYFKDCLETRLRTIVERIKSDGHDEFFFQDKIILINKKESIEINLGSIYPVSSHILSMLGFNEVWFENYLFKNNTVYTINDYQHRKCN